MGQFFTPLSTELMLTALALWVALTGATVALWDRVPVARIAVRSVGLTLSMLCLSLAAFILVNQQIRFFLHWRDVLGGW